MADDLVKILDGNTFVVSDNRGDIEASLTDPTGLFSFDTRFLSKWVLTINGERLNSLSVDDMQYFESRFFLVPGTGTVYVDAKLSVIRRRSVGAGFDEEITVLNHDNQPVKLAIRIDAGCDFADLFEVKDALRKKGKFSTRVERSRLVLEYTRDTYRALHDHRRERAREVRREGPHLRGHDPGARRMADDHRRRRPDLPTLEALDERPARRSKPDMQRDLDRWLEAAPTLKADSADLERTYRRSLVDLAALRFSPLSASGRSLPAAGLPWFMTMFGRDSIFTSLQALPFNSELAATTLRELGLRQGTRIDDFRDEDPGRILHEMRYGEMTAFDERPHSPYYGNADATPLFVVLLDEYERWTGDTKLVRELEYEARAALNWIDEYANLRGDGYIWYQRRNEKTGLENQCWKDSWDSISSRDGTIPGFPRATCELQGYAYDAKMRAARLARTVWKDAAFADDLEKQAADLKRRFNRDFWVADDEYFALALDENGEQVDALASNNGHLLWSGIVDKSKAKAVVRHLMGPRLFSGWGVRTLAERSRPLQPDRLSRRHRVAVRQLVHRLGTAALRLQGRGRADRVGDPRRGRVLRRPTARSIRRIPARRNEVPGAVPDRVQPASVVDRHAAAPPAHDARPRTDRRSSHRRSAPARRHGSDRAARHPRPLGPHRRLRPRTLNRLTTRSPS